MIGGAAVANGPSSAKPVQHAEEDAEPLAEPLVSTPARLVASVSAFYPRAARAAEVEADVILEIVLDATGRVAQARLAKGAAGFGLDESALQAIRGYRFSPARKDGRPVRMRMRWTVQFRLR